MHALFFWSRFPFVRITALFMAGIVASVFIPGHQRVVLLLIIVLVMVLFPLRIFRRKLFLHYNWIYGLTVALLGFGFGYLRLYFAREDVAGNHIKYQGEIQAYRAIVVAQPLQKGKFYKTTVEVKSAKVSEWTTVSGKVNLYVKSLEPPFAYGDELLIKGPPQQVPGPMNPEEFNYKRYLGFLNVYHQQFADSSDMHILLHNNGNIFIAASLKLRHYFSETLRQHIGGAKELAIANALLLGNKEDLDDDIKNTYAASGAMHVLAVSGLHVGIIYFIILFILKYTLRSHKKEWMVAVIAIPMLWAYAFITGLSPSVLRAVTLFSILALGRATGRKADMINMLAVSAFILLLFNPFLLMQVGFQLSYVAVLGIIFLYPLIRRLWMPTSWLGISVWDITAISIAAQIATFPMSILYFHRFAPYFLVSNLLVIPAATLMVWLGVLLFSISWVSATLAGWVGFALEWLIRAVNYVLGGIYHFPGSDWDSLYLDIPQTWLLYFIIAGFVLYVVNKNKGWAFATSACMVLLTILLGFRWVENNQSRQVVVYNVPHHYAVDFIQSGSIKSLMDSALMDMEDNIHFHIKPQRLLKGASISANAHELVWKQLPFGNATVWNGVSVLVVNDKLQGEDLPFDIVIESKPRRTEKAVILDIDDFKGSNKN